MMPDSGMLVIRANTAARRILPKMKPQQETGKQHDGSLAGARSHRGGAIVPRTLRSTK
jgi:hypothetical protein